MAMENSKSSALDIPAEVWRQHVAPMLDARALRHFTEAAPMFRDCIGHHMLPITGPDVYIYDTRWHRETGRRFMIVHKSAPPGTLATKNPAESDAMLRCLLHMHERAPDAHQVRLHLILADAPGAAWHHLALPTYVHLFQRLYALVIRWNWQSIWHDMSPGDMWRAPTEPASPFPSNAFTSLTELRHICTRPTHLTFARRHLGRAQALHDIYRSASAKSTVHLFSPHAADPEHENFVWHGRVVDGAIDAPNPAYMMPFQGARAIESAEPCMMYRGLDADEDRRDTRKNARYTHQAIHILPTSWMRTWTPPPLQQGRARLITITPTARCILSASLSDRHSLTAQPMFIYTHWLLTAVVADYIVLDDSETKQGRGPHLRRNVVISCPGVLHAHTDPEPVHADGASLGTRLVVQASRYADTRSPGFVAAVITAFAAALDPSTFALEATAQLSISKWVAAYLPNYTMTHVR